MIAPVQAAADRLYVWHGEFFGHKPALDIALLGHGFHIVYMKINDMLGSPDAPVCDFKSWPGGKGKGKGDPKNWALVLKLRNFSNEATALASKANPIDNLAPLAKYHVPLLHVFGDLDDVVPWEENTGIIESRYKELGADITLIRKVGVGHHPHGLEDSQPIIDFILKNTK